LHIQDTIGTSGVSAIIQGRNLTGVYLRTHDTLNAPYKSWVMQNQTFTQAPLYPGNCFSLFYSDGYSFNSYPFAVGGGSPTNSLVIAPEGVGVGTNTPVSKLQIKGGDVYVEDIASGVILKSPNGNCWRVTIDDTGNLIRTLIVCP
jgi:hypothetical protein